MPRVRSTDTRVSTTLQQKCTTASGTPVSAPYNVPAVYSAATTGAYKEIQDENHGDYYRLRRSGRIIMGRLSIQDNSRTQVNGYATGYNPIWKETWVTEGDLIALVEAQPATQAPDLMGQYMSAMTNLALVSAYVKMNQSDMLLGETLSDMDKTVGMLRRPFRRAGELLAAMQRRKLKHLRKSASNLAQACSESWLEYRYGWQPVVLDAQEIFEQVHVIRGRIVRNLVARATESGSWTTTKSFSSVVGYVGTTPHYFTGSTTSEQRVVASAGVMYRVKPRTTTEDLQKICGFRPRDQVMLMWEKIPFSFVGDWFVNVGDWLQAITPDPFVEVRGSWTTTKSLRVTKTAASVSRPLGTYTLTGSAGSSVRTSNNVNRNPNPSLPSLPVLRPQAISTLHQVDGLSLIVGSLKSAYVKFKSGH